MRLDSYLVYIGRFDSRQKAQEAIKNAQVRLNGAIVKKPSFHILHKPKDEQTSSLPYHIEILGERFVSRAGIKLQGFLHTLEKFIGGKAKWRSAIDVGAARGGFSEVLLRYGVERIVCVDVGSNQLHSSIACDPRVEVFEQCDIRAYVKTHLSAMLDSKTHKSSTTESSIVESNTTESSALDSTPSLTQQHKPFDLAVCDVSFIALSQVLPSLIMLSDELIMLFKPQFEVGRSVKRNKKGVVQEPRAIESALQAQIHHIHASGFSVLLTERSSITGKEGNAEFFIYARKGL